MVTDNQRKKLALTAINHITKRPQAFYDIGIGPLQKSEWKHWKETYTELQLFGCEPNPVLYKQLLQRFPGRLFNCGISDAETIKLYMEPDNHKTFGRSSIFPVEGLTKKQLEVDCMTLDQFDEESGKPEDIILWMDIEGSELIALKSGVKLLKSGRVIAINLEVRNSTAFTGWPTAIDIDIYLTSVGYKKAQDYNNQKTHWDTIYVKA